MQPMNPTIRVCADHEFLSRQAAERILSAVARKPDLLLCAAAGFTPLRSYKLLAENHKRQPDIFRALRVIKIDEWGGLEMKDAGSCECQLREHLIAPLQISDAGYIAFNSAPADPEKECERIKSCLSREGPIDFCVLGLGVNGHIAMNEPASSLQPEAHVAELTEATLSHPMLANSRSKPGFGLTLGMAEILASKESLLLVSGARKRDALHSLLQREITTQFPASFLWLHPNWTLLCDQEAAAGMNLGESFVSESKTTSTLP